MGSAKPSPARADPELPPIENAAPQFRYAEEQANSSRIRLVDEELTYR